MNNLKNQVQLIGRLGNDPDMICFDDGKVKTKAVICTTDQWRDYSDDAPPIVKSQWHDIVAWGPCAEQLAKGKKGSRLVVQGRLTYRAYEDGDGVTRYITEIIVNNLLWNEEIL